MINIHNKIDKLDEKSCKDVLHSICKYISNKSHAEGFKFEVGSSDRSLPILTTLRNVEFRIKQFIEDS